MSEIEWDKIPELDEKVLNILVLESGERIMIWWNGSVETFETTVVTQGRVRKKQKIVEAKGEEDGLLVLTNRRLLWVNKKGRIGKTYRVTHEMSLLNIRSISRGGKIRKFVSLIDSENEYWFRLSGKYSSPDEFREIVRLIREEREREVEAEKKKERIHIMMDFSSLTDYMKEGGMLLKTIKCTECNGPLNLPESGNEITCEHCGATIYAQDIFEKIESLIG